MYLLRSGSGKIRIFHHDPPLRELESRRFERADRAVAGIQHVELLRALGMERAADVDHIVLRRVFLDRDRTWILRESRKEMEGNRRRDEHGKALGDPPREVIRDQEVVI